MKPLMPCSSIRRRASRAPILPLCGSMLAKAIIMSLLALAASAISSLGIRRRPSCDSLSTVNMIRPILRSR
ncbi:hypothetical protein D3C72_2524060 [compost metagenome]